MNMFSKQHLSELVNSHARIVWDVLCELRPQLVKYDCPLVKLNGRLWRSAGRCYQETLVVELGTKFLIHSQQYHNTMLQVILPHELIHAADYALYGESEAKCGHGKEWNRLMLDYGLPANPFHTMEIKR